MSTSLSKKIDAFENIPMWALLALVIGFALTVGLPLGMCLTEGLYRFNTGLPL